MCLCIYVHLQNNIYITHKYIYVSRCVYIIYIPLMIIFNLLALHDLFHLFDNQDQGSEIDKNDIFLNLGMLSLTKTFFLLHI